MRTGLALSIFGLVGALALGTGCSAQAGNGMNPDPGGSPPGTNPTDPKDPPPKPPAPTPPEPTATYAGLYEATSALDLTQGGVLPGVMGPIVSSLAYLKDCPGASIVGMIDTFSPGTIGGSYNTPPPGQCPTSGNFLRSLATSFLSTLITNLLYNGQPVVAQIATIIDGLAEMFKYIDVIENVKIGVPDASMGTDVEQQVTKISVMMFGNKQTVPLSAATMAGAYAKTRGSISALNAPVADANFSFQAAQNLSIPVGEAAYGAVGPILFAPFGATDLSGALKNLINCQGLASSTSSNSILNGVIGGILAGVCDAGLTAIAVAAEAEIKQIVLHADQGDNVSGKLFDASIKRPQLDYFSDKLEVDVKWGIGAGTVSSKLIGERKAN